LRKGYEVDPDPVGHGVARGKHAFDAGDAAFGIDVDMGADMRRAVRDGKRRLAGGLPPRVYRQAAADGALVIDLVDQAGPDLVVVPSMPEQGFVEMGMSFDQAWQRDTALAVSTSVPAGTAAVVKRPSVT